MNAQQGQQNDGAHNGKELISYQIHSKVTALKEKEDEGKIGEDNRNIPMFLGQFCGLEVVVKRYKRSPKKSQMYATSAAEHMITIQCHSLINVVCSRGIDKDSPEFDYVAFDRYYCTLEDLIENPRYKKRFNLYKDHMPSRYLMRLLRGTLNGLAGIHELGITHHDIRPGNIWISADEPYRAMVANMGFSRNIHIQCSPVGPGLTGWHAPEQVGNYENCTMASDMFGYGCVLFFCITQGEHPFGPHPYHVTNIEFDNVEFALVIRFPEAQHLLTQLLDHDAHNRPKSKEALNHPFFWNASKRMEFFRVTSDKFEGNKTQAQKLELESSNVCGAYWGRKMPSAMIEYLASISPPVYYRYWSLVDLVRAIRNLRSHFDSAPEYVKNIIGNEDEDEDIDLFFRKRFPTLLMAVYKIFLESESTETWFEKYSMNQTIEEVYGDI